MPSAHDTDASLAFGQTAPVTLRQAATLIRAMAHEQSFLLLAFQIHHIDLVRAIL